jgi:hypothetical protein
MDFKNVVYKPHGSWWLMPIILATCEAEIRRIVVRGQPRQIVPKTPISKITRAKWTRVELIWLKWQSACFASVKP